MIALRQTPAIASSGTICTIIRAAGAKPPLTPHGFVYGRSSVARYAAHSAQIARASITVCFRISQTPGIASR
jgi:hypothetical protein